MQEYSIFWLTDEIANHYFYKSDLLYLFLKGYQNNPEREDLKIQHEYITQNFPKESLIAHIKNNSKKRYYLQLSGTQIKIYNNKQYIALHIREKQLNFRCETLQDAEELLFPVLRQFQLSLFIIGESTANYGWISPILTTSKYQEQRVLYSYL